MVDLISDKDDRSIDEATANTVEANSTPLAVLNQWRRRIGQSITRYMPKRLYARSLLIVVTPIIILQSVVAFVFMERHWQTVTQRLSFAVVSDIAAVVDLLEVRTREEDIAEIIRVAQERLGLKIDILPNEPLPAPTPKPFFSILDQALSEQITRQINRPYWIDTVGNSKIVEIRIRQDEDVLRVVARRSSAYASNSHIFLVWMVGTAFVVVGIAILFLRNQIRPIQQLAEASESFGRGREMPKDFRPRGADEVRRASRAFIRMRERIERQIEQRTTMLTGVSHDLRTILTRFKLQLAVSHSEKDKEALNADIDEMQKMLEGYIAFAQGDVTEETSRFELASLVPRFAEDAEVRGKVFTSSIIGDTQIDVRPNAITRLVSNLVANGFRYAHSVDVTMQRTASRFIIQVDDDGPGIPPENHEDVFKPFFRMDEARNLNESGTGLGLAIALDIARAHGGDITLAESPLGGLRATLTLPV